MKNRTLYLLSPFLSFVLLLSACRSPKELEYRDFKNLKVDKIGAAASMIRMDLIYYNPNNFGMQLKLTDLDIYVDNNYLGHSLQEYQIHIPKRGEFTLPVQVEVDMKNLLKNALGTFLGKEILLKVTGKVTLGKANVYKIFPVNYEGLHKFSLY